MNGARVQVGAEALDPPAGLGLEPGLDQLDGPARLGARVDDGAGALGQRWPAGAESSK